MNGYTNDKRNEILNYIKNRVIEILINEYKFKREKAVDVFEESTLNGIMKEEKMYHHITHYSAEYWAIDVFEEYEGLSN